MKKTLLFLVTLTAGVYALPLTVANGMIKAHTEVFGDSSIDPSTSKLVSHLSMDSDPQTLKGTIDISMTGLVSNNSARDEHMHEAIDSKKFKDASYAISHVTKNSKGYSIEGMLNFHGIERPLTIHADIFQSGKSIHIGGHSSFVMSNYGVIPPKLLFLVVRDRVDITIDVNLNQM